MELYILIAKHCLKQEDESDLVEIDGYEMFFFFFYQVEGCEELHIDIDKEFEAKVWSKMPIVLDEVMECVTVQVERENLKDIPKPGPCADSGRNS